jgi:hypothetical protein
VKWATLVLRSLKISLKTRTFEVGLVSLWITGYLSEVFRPREIKVGHFT